MVIDPKGAILAHSEPAAFPIGHSILAGAEAEHAAWHVVLNLVSATTQNDGDTVVGLVPIQSNGTTIGLVHLRLSTDEVKRAIGEGRRILLLLSIGMAVVGVLAGLAWSLSTLRPLKALAGSMAALGRGQDTRWPNRPQISAFPARACGRN